MIDAGALNFAAVRVATRAPGLRADVLGAMELHLEADGPLLVGVPAPGMIDVFDRVSRRFAETRAESAR
jgi:hypothetical protein